MKPENSRTSPWNKDEYLMADKYSLVYTVATGGGLVVHLPGQKKTTVDALVKAGFEVKMPKITRTSMFGSNRKW